MGTSIITSPTFTFATMIDFRLPLVSASAVPTIAAAIEESEIAACALAAFPRCGLTAQRHCKRSVSCKS